MDHPLNIYLMFKHWSDVAEENDSAVTEFLPNVKDLKNFVYNLIRLEVKIHSFRSIRKHNIKSIYLHVNSVEN